MTSPSRVRFSSLGDVQAYLRQHNVQMVDMKFSDLWGRWHRVTIPAHEFGGPTMRDGIGFDGSSVGLKSVKSGDMVLLPDLDTAFLDPFWDVPTLSLICSAFEADTKKPFARDPRNIALRAEQVMLETGVADESRWGLEYEFYVFDEVAFENDVNRASYRVDSREAVWRSATGGHGHLIPLHGGYHALAPQGPALQPAQRDGDAPGGHGSRGQVPPP